VTLPPLATASMKPTARIPTLSSKIPSIHAEISEGNWQHQSLLFDNRLPGNPGSPLRLNTYESQRMLTYLHILREGGTPTPMRRCSWTKLWCADLAV
jgi:hypothetical protein